MNELAIFLHCNKNKAGGTLLHSKHTFLKCVRYKTVAHFLLTKANQKDPTGCGTSPEIQKMEN